ncbi:MAG: DUF1844 domain-containing protein [Pirellulaceae bacterium]
MSNEPKPKLIIDEDWKGRAQAEKEALAREAQAKQAADSLPTGNDRNTAEARGEAASQADLPPASFTVLVGTLGTQALASLGEMPHPSSGEPEVDLPYARHFIDTLQMLEEKTRGNLTQDEARILSELLHGLRLTYVAVRDGQPAKA